MVDERMVKLTTDQVIYIARFLGCLVETDLTSEEREETFVTVYQPNDGIVVMDCDSHKNYRHDTVCWLTDYAEEGILPLDDGVIEEAPNE